MSIEPTIDTGKPQPGDRCAWYLRVSTPKQKLEHQREHVLRACEEYAIDVPGEMRFEDKEKRHKSAKRQDFQRLLDTVKAGRLDWILICSFDRWGVADVDEFFEFRRLLLKHDVQLWSVVDQMNLTGITESDYFRVVAMAIGATKYVEQMAEKNILKMIEMAKQGWAASGNAPYGIDLVCYPLSDVSKPMFRVVRLRYRPYLYRVLTYSKDSQVERDEHGMIVSSRLAVAKEEVTERMPLRDKKATGYRYEPTIERGRIDAINLAYQMYDAGMGWSEVSADLWKMGHKHYEKPFQDHALETILKNPAYIGLPAWGKVGTGAYRVLLNGRPTRRKRKAADTVYLEKDVSEWVQPTRPLFFPLVSPDVWHRVQDRLARRGHVNSSFGKPKTRSTARHPANGKLVCPDCEAKMVLGSSCPAQGAKGKKVRCFNCGTYRKNGRLQCHANTIGWDKIDRAIAELFQKVKDRIDGLTTDVPLAKAVLQEEWATKTDLGRIIRQIVNAYLSRCQFENGQLQASEEDTARLVEQLENRGEYIADMRNQSSIGMSDILDLAMEWYAKDFSQNASALRDEAQEIDSQLARIAEAIAGGIPSQTVRAHLSKKMAALEERKKVIEPLLVPLTAKADVLLDQLKAIRQTIQSARRADTARLLDAFVERIIPIFDVKQGSNGQRRAIVRGFEFHPRQDPPATNILPQATSVLLRQPMENASSRTGTDSWPRPG